MQTRSAQVTAKDRLTATGPIRGRGPGAPVYPHSRLLRRGVPSFIVEVRRRPRLAIVRNQVHASTIRPYEFTTPLKLLKVFFREVERPLDERGIPNDL
jgi:hypothetical protein